MKVKVTKKEIRENYKNVIRVGYCELQYLLRGKNPNFYTSGTYGWRADIYQINYNTCIVTGYAPFGNIKIERNTIQKYEEKAIKICHDYSLNWEQETTKLDKLLDKFIKEVIKESEE